jgi:asparagine synthase (glutamine-hydrolysing)
MSGFAGIIHLDGAPADPDLLEKMTRLTERHGGDDFNIHCEQEFGFGHSLLATMPESANEQQPFSFDQNTWIVGDVRVDAREELISELTGQDRRAGLSQPDIELVLRAYHAWGEHCVDHLLGDFAFAIWNRKERRLFCARDSFGVKPFYYALRGDTFIFSNDIDSMRSHPNISKELNEAAICDYLAFGYNLDEKRTYFADIDRLSPSHALLLQAGLKPQLHKYSHLVVGQRIRYKTTEEYCEHFLELFSKAVSDRLRTDRVGFELSGGLDSTSVAAMAAQCGRNIAGFSCLAVTTDNSSSDTEDQEAYFAAIAADSIGSEHLTIAADRREDFYAYRSTSQPFSSPFMSNSLKFAALIRGHGHVMFSGQGGDPFLHGSGLPLLDQFREKSLNAFSRDLLKSAFQNRTFRGLGLRSLWAGNSPRIRMQEFPSWLKSGFLTRSGSVDRWRLLYEKPGRYPQNCQVELAWDELHMPVWTHLFEDYYHDLFCGIDCRHPLFDIRLVNCLFAFPASIKEDKRLLRLSFNNMLPDTVLSRPKKGVVCDRVQSRLSDKTVFNTLDLSLDSLASWIDTEGYLQALMRYASGEPGDRYTSVAPLNLELWMNSKL